MSNLDPIYYVPSKLEDRIYPDPATQRKALENTWQDFKQHFQLVREEDPTDGDSQDRRFPVYILFDQERKDTHHLQIIPCFDEILDAQSRQYQINTYDDSFIAFNNTHAPTRKTYTIFKQPRKP